jgi:choline dehydrogenase-like flavoprotein
LEAKAIHDDFSDAQGCKVRGPENLHAVDASVFPIITSAVPNLTVMMLGERAAEWLKSTMS